MTGDQVSCGPGKIFLCKVGRLTGEIVASLHLSPLFSYKQARELVDFQNQASSNLFPHCHSALAYQEKDGAPLSIVYGPKVIAF